MFSKLSQFLNTSKEIYFTYAFSAWWSFSLSFVSIFIPLRLYELGINIKTIVFIYIVHFVVMIPVNYLTGFLVGRCGYKLPFLLGIPFRITLLFLLVLYPVYHFSSVWIGIFSALGPAFSDVTRNIIFYRNTSDQERGVQLSLIGTFGRIGTMIGPLLGGIVYHYLGFSIAVMCAGVLMVLSIIPLSRAKDQIVQKTYNVYRFLFQKDNLRFSLLYFFGGLEWFASESFYPFFLAILFGDALKLGVIGFIVPFFLMFFSLFIGKAIDRKTPATMLQVGGVLLCVAWFLRAYAVNPLWVVILLILSSFVDEIEALPRRKLVYKRALELDAPQEFLVFGEQISYVSRILVLGIIYLFVDNPFKIMFMIAAVVGLYYALFATWQKRMLLQEVRTE